MFKRKFSYRQAVVKTKEHSSLNYGQIVEIVDETKTEYKIRANELSPTIILEKKDLIIN